MDAGSKNPGILALQEVARGKPEWTSAKQGKWATVTYQHTDTWRGCGLFYDDTCWTLMRKKGHEFGAWFRVRHVEILSEVWIGSTYIAPHFCNPRQGLARTMPLGGSVTGVRQRDVDAGPVGLRLSCATRLAPIMMLSFSPSRSDSQVTLRADYACGKGSSPSPSTRLGL